MTGKGRNVKAHKSAPKPSIIWILLAKEFVSDRKTGSASAINIVEDIFLPATAFVDGGEVSVINLDQPINLGFTVDWRWPVQVETSEPIPFQVDWHTPGGQSFLADAGPQVLNRPIEGNRSHVEVGFSNLPLENEGVYHFEILLDGETAARYPIRIWKAKEEQNAPEKKTTKRSRKTKTDPSFADTDMP